MKARNKATQANFRLTERDREILKETVDMGRALNESDALRMAIRQLGESNYFTRKIKAA